MITVRYKHPDFLYLFSFLILGLSGILMDIYYVDTSISFAALFAFCVWCFCLWYLVRVTKNGFFSLPTGYLLLLGVFHLGLVVPFSLGLRLDNEPVWLFSPHVSKALALCIIAFSFCTAAACFSRIQRNNDPIGRPHDRVIKRRGRSVYLLVWGGILLGLFGAVLLLIGISSLNILEIGYGETYAVRMTQDPRLFGTGFLLLFMGGVIAASGATGRQIRWIIGFAFMLWTPLFLYGFRGHVIVNSMCMLILWHNVQPRKAKRVAVIALVGIMIAAPAVKLMRNVERFSWIDAVKEVQPLDFVTEAGGSMRPLVETIGEIESFGSGYWYGRSYFTALLRVIPNLNIQWEAKGTNEPTTPGHWITARVNPWIYARGGGLGYSGVAEPYLNFGITGVITFFSLIGYLLMRFDCSYQTDDYKAAALMCAYAALLWTTRNDFANFFRPAVWSLTFVSMLSFLASKKRMRDSSSLLHERQS